MSKNKKQNRSPVCHSCGSSEIVIVTMGRYLFMTSMLPVLVVLAIGLFFEPLFFLFIPAVLVTNYILSKRKAPIVICRSCRHVEKKYSLPAGAEK